MLTRRQLQMLKFIVRYQSDNDGVSPSFDEMLTTAGLASKSGVHRIINSLEERGFIRRMRGRARSIEVLKLPESLTRKPDDSLTIPLTSADRRKLDAVARRWACTPEEAALKMVRAA